MAIKVLKSGAKRDKKWYGICNICSAILSSDESDLLVQAGTIRNDWINFAWESCPECESNGSTVCFYSGESLLGKEIKALLE
jgi:stalled ribosome rescue protein Dom34